MRTNFMNYHKLNDTWSNNIKEQFFVAYAVGGPMVIPSKGLRAGMPVNHPIGGPVNLPSPLNTRWQYLPPNPTAGIL